MQLYRHCSLLIAYEEYDPTQPIVNSSAADSADSQGSHNSMEISDESYDPIVSAYSLADPETLNAEDAPGNLTHDSFILC